jgi:hypothetical protein
VQPSNQRDEARHAKQSAKKRAELETRVSEYTGKRND